MDGENTAHKAHKRSVRGKGALKQKARAPKTGGQNPKAYGAQSSRKMLHEIQRRADKMQKYSSESLVNRQGVTPPPDVVVVVGPHGSGKSTLIRQLVRGFTHKRLATIRGPVTCLVSKSKRVTFFEAPTDLPAMIDLSKIADLALLTIDASRGLEMETFEFLNLLQLHGFPKVAAVITNLDRAGAQKNRRKLQRKLKLRFGKELGAAAKLFALSDFRHNEYPRADVLKISRYISQFRYFPLRWRNSHPAVLVDRVEDLTPAADVARDRWQPREVAMFGYVRGTFMRTEQRVHIPGVGDFLPDEMRILKDPAPTPEGKKTPGGGVTGTIKLRDKDRVLYAPWSDAGSLLYDGDSVYVHVRGDGAPAGAREDAERVPGEKILDEMREGADDREGGSGAELQLFSNAPAAVPFRPMLDSSTLGRARHAARLEGQEFNEREWIQKVAGDSSDADEAPPSEQDGVFARSDSDFELPESSSAHSEKEPSDDLNPLSAVKLLPGGADATSLAWKDRTSTYAEAAKDRPPTLAEIVYGTVHEQRPATKPEAASQSVETMQDAKGPRQLSLFEDSESGELESDDGEEAISALFSRPGLAGLAKRTSRRSDVIHTSLPTTTPNCRYVVPPGIDDCTVLCDAPVSHPGLPPPVAPSMYSVVKELFATGTALWEAGSDADEASDEEGTDGQRVVIEEAEDFEFDVRGDIERREAAARLNKLNEDVDVQKQLAHADTSVIVPGSYVRVLFREFPAEFPEHFDPTNPLLLGGIQPGEQSFGFVRCRIKRHRWHPKILKTFNPLVFSVGWRRFQSLPVYSMQDPNGRNRMLKYTPEHLHCIATFWAPVVPPSTGVIAFSKVSNTQRSFRVALTGTVLEVVSRPEIVKKLKLVGYPLRSKQNTCFVKDMFSSQREAVHFLGAKLRTVSGIRGEVKKAMRDPPGVVRCTFENKVLRSDIIFLRTWYPVLLHRFHNPVITHLFPRGVRQWRAVRSVAEIRREKDMAVPLNKDSLYKPIERGKRTFAPFRVPEALMERLPFETKQKVTARAQPVRYATLMTPEDRTKHNAMKVLTTVSKQSYRKRAAKQEDARKRMQQKRRAEEQRVAAVHKTKAAARRRLIGKAETRDRKRGK
eukprot:gnl/Chilomastix_cuspidata/473.p1 GENE.gnl/Chilomastix_cuspidata/473~~gnl/Chilomastix_cuspidata/473.p1  ORF type:complete len:1115 (-),score=304.92 gnl/Chilomastix_cuspidata/473:1407-4751(-)